MCHFVNRVLEKLSTFLVLRSAFISRQVKDDAIWRRLSLGVAYQRGEICRSRLLWSAITKPSHPHENVSSAHADALQRRYNGSHDPFPIDISPEHQARQSSTSEAKSSLPRSCRKKTVVPHYCPTTRISCHNPSQLLPHALKAQPASRIQDW
jgi:hypothetical protein